MKRLIPLGILVVLVFALAAFASQTARPALPQQDAQPAVTAPAAQQQAPAVVTPQQDTKQAASCQRCGDGYCAPSCENEFTCPRDCKSTKK